MSADTIVPGGGSLTVAPNDATALAAWGQRGPAANPQQLNRYTYVSNNPIKNTDPTGHETCVIGNSYYCAQQDYKWFWITAGTIIGGTVVVVAATEATNDTAETATDPVIVPHDTERQARRAADRQSGAGKHGVKEPLPDDEFHDGSQAPEGNPGVRTGYRSPDSGSTVHHDPYGHDFGDGTTIPPHYGVTPPAIPGVKTRTTHHTYPPQQPKPGPQ